MHDSARPHGTLNRRRFLSLSSQSLLALSLSQLIPVNLLAEERQAELPDGLLRMGRDIFPHDFISDSPLRTAPARPGGTGAGADRRRARRAAASGTQGPRQALRTARRSRTRGAAQRHREHPVLQGGAQQPDVRPVRQQDAIPAVRLRGLVVGIRRLRQPRLRRSQLALSQGASRRRQQEQERDSPWQLLPRTTMASW